MDKEYPPDAWKRLGRELEARRGQLGYGFRQRGNFLRDRGGPPPSVKMLARLERGERTAYPPATVTLLEEMYGWAPGSFEAVLSGGEPVLPGTPPPPAAAPAPAPGDEYAEVITMLLEEYPTRQWWDLYGASWRVQEDGRLNLLRLALLRRRQSAEAPEDNGVRTERARDNPAS
jgi:hypothetical protein